MLQDGVGASAVISKLAKGDAKVRQRWRKRYNKWATEKTFQDMLGQYTSAEALGQLIPAIQALGRRAGKGNVPAIKLLLEATGYYSPRVDHDHSGEIKITVQGIPRPEATVDEVVTDAVVVED